MSEAVWRRGLMIVGCLILMVACASDNTGSSEAASLNTSGTTESTQVTSSNPSGSDSESTGGASRGGSLSGGGTPDVSDDEGAVADSEDDSTSNAEAAAPSDESQRLPGAMMGENGDSGMSASADEDRGAGGAASDDGLAVDDSPQKGTGGGATASMDAGGTGNEGVGGGAPESPSDPSLDGEPRIEARATLTSVRQEHSVAALNGEVYVIGGFTPSVTASVQAYNPDSDTWRDVADFPEALHHANVATVGGLLYVLGFNRGGSFTEIDGRTFAYDPASDEWSERASLPTGMERASSCVAALGNRIYLFGGSRNTNGNSPTSAESTEYDAELDTWEILPLMPEPREHCVAGEIDDVLYIVSGRNGSIAGVSVESWSYAPQTQLFTERAPIPTPRGGTAGAVVGGKIYVFGGEGNSADPNGIFHEVEAYDPSTDTWEVLPEMLMGRHGFAAAAVDSRIYLPGGATSQGFGAGDAHTVFFFE